jgi:formylglycine-generating enzyme required for sulfatase activity
MPTNGVCERRGWVFVRIYLIFRRKLNGTSPTSFVTDGRLYPWGNEWDLSRGNFIQDVNAPGYPERAKEVDVTWKTPVDGYPGGVSPYGVWDMVGNVAEWTMSVTWVPNTNREGPMVKANPVKDIIPPYWYYHMVTWQNVEDFFSVPMYIGFRPVRDRWQREHWLGFRAETDSASE